MTLTTLKRFLVFLVFAAGCGLAHAGTTVYNFNFSVGGTGSLTYNDSTGVANPITMDFGSLGSITTDFGASLTATVFGTPPQEAVVQDGTFFPLKRAGETTNYAAVRLYSDGSFCVRLLPESDPCVVSGTYRIAPDLPPQASSGTYSFNFSGGGTGYFQYNGDTSTVESLRYDFGAFGAGATSFGASLTALVFGNPPSSSVIQDNTFFSLSGGTAYGLRLRTNGTFCVRPDAGTCGAGDLFSGTYQIALAEPGTLESGSNVVAVPEAVDVNGDPVENPPSIVLTFDSVTNAGEVKVEVIPADSGTAPSLPQGFALAGTSSFFDITTTSSFTGGVEVCVGYSDVGVNEAALRLLHFTGGQWEDVTSPGSPDTTNNVICGLTTSFSPFAPAVVLDSDNDGLPDYLELLQYGTNPDVADTDGDGLTDGTEVNVTLTDPLLPDSDGDGLTDGQEVQLNTNPRDPDTDGDGISDAIDPLPLTPGATSGFIEDELRKLAVQVLAYDLSVFDAPNNNARKGRRNALANKLIGAANEVGTGKLDVAAEELEDLLEKLDDAASPPDWMNSSAEKTSLRNNVILIIGLIALEPH